MKEMPIEEFMHVWEDFLFQVGSTQAKCLSVTVMEKLSQQCATIFEVNDNNYNSSTPPPRMKESGQLRKLLETIDSRMLLK